MKIISLLWTINRKEKLDDFECMYKILEENYPFFEVNKRLNGVDWLSNKDEYVKMIKAAKDDEEFYTALYNILTYLNNGHTQIINKDKYSFYQKSCKNIAP